MRSLRARVFVTTAVLLTVATLAAGLLSRQATLVEERQVVGPARLPRLDDTSARVQQAFAERGIDGLREALSLASRGQGVRLIAIDPDKHVIAASSSELEAVRVKAAGPQGLVSLEIGGRDARTSVELRGVPTIPLRTREGDEAARVYVLPDDAAGPLHVNEPLVAPWIRITAGTALIALAIAFVIGNRILRPVGELTRAARRMREGDLDVRVDARGDDEIARLARAFNEMAARLSETERRKRQMVSDVAHELRSPVTNLRCALEAIQDGLVAADRAQIDALHSDTLLLQRLIGDLQELALADSGELSLERSVVPLEPIARRVALGEPGGNQIVVAIDDDAAAVIGDPGRIEQMLRNLVDNARRHTPPGGTIAIRTRRNGEDVAIEVTDSGEGIDGAHLARIFERFYRVDGSRDRATGGAGLGLAIVRRLAEAQGGSVTASSDGPGRGATFSIRMPSPAAAAHRIESRA